MSLVETFTGALRNRCYLADIPSLHSLSEMHMTRGSPVLASV
jgi:hypothetical protein